jgi:hypothetical protein
MAAFSRSASELPPIQAIFFLLLRRVGPSNEKLNVAAVKLYHVSTRELAEQKSETVLKITTMEGETIYLHGPEADDALAILEPSSS